MNKIFFLFLLMLLVITGCQNKISDPEKYNEQCVDIFEKVQYPTDSLILYLYDYSVYSDTKDIDSNLIEQKKNKIDIMYYKVFVSLKEAKTKLKKIEFYKNDNGFKEAINDAFDTIAIYTNEDNFDFLRMEDVIKKYNINEFGQKFFRSYNSAVDRVIKAQQKFDAMNGYIIEDKIIRNHLE